MMSIMIHSTKQFCFVLLLCLTVSVLLSHDVAAADVAVARFGSDGLTGWETKEFKGRTSYQLVQDDGHTVLKAVANGAASGLVKKMSFDPAQQRYLKWSWKISHTIANGDERTKKGDDYAARIYVIFPGRFFWQTRALNYIWANRLAKGDFAVNAFASSAIMLAVESGPSRTGQWIVEERDILADYRLVFGEDPPKAGAIAIMTDTDNTGGEAAAWYGDITLSTTR